MNGILAWKKRDPLLALYSVSVFSQFFGLN
jgi:hypothetical protein